MRGERINPRLRIVNGFSSGGDYSPLPEHPLNAFLGGFRQGIFGVFRVAVVLAGLALVIGLLAKGVVL